MPKCAKCKKDITNDATAIKYTIDASLYENNQILPTPKISQASNLLCTLCHQNILQEITQKIKNKANPNY